jgi:hypothetical protein
MPSSISSSEEVPEAGQGPRAHHGPLAPGLRLTASDRPGIAQPVPERDIPALPWTRIALCVMILVAALTGAWEVKMRSLGYEVGDLGDDPSAWVAQRRRLDAAQAMIAIVGDSRILYDTNLDRFQQLTGVRPVQLAIEGSNGLPILEDIADRSPFAGLVIVGIADQAYFREGPGLGRAQLKRGKFESPAQWTSYVLSKFLRRHSAMLEDDAALSKFISRTDTDWRVGVHGPYDDVWKVAVNHDDRQTLLWPQVERNAFLREHAVGRWMMLFGFLVPTPEVIDKVVARTEVAVAKIRARGGEVVFVRPPSIDSVHGLEEQKLPRAKGWDRLLRIAQVKGVHFQDVPDAQDLVLPERSHLNSACAVIFTDAYVRALAQLTPRLVVQPDAPPTLHPAQCAESSAGNKLPERPLAKVANLGKAR